MSLWHQLTDAERETLVADIVAGLDMYDVPVHLRQGLVHYFGDGILPGSFLQAVLCNDLREAAVRASPPNVLIALPRLMAFLAARGGQAWGSRDAVLAWTTTPDRIEV